jgi:hypothetical protein
MRHLAFNVIGGCAVVAASFFTTLFIHDQIYGLPYPDSIRVEHARTIKRAIETYRRSHGTYPSPFTGNALSDLKPYLVDTGILKALPEDPSPALGQSSQYRYVSDDGSFYGILIPLQSAIGNVPAGQCVTGHGTAGRALWSNAPSCPF